MRIRYFVGLLLAGAVVAAPLPKEREVPLKPPTKAEAEASTNNLKLLGLSWHNYESANGFFPADIYSKDKKPLLSWRVLILPYIDHDELYKEFKLDEPWDSAHNKKLIEKMPKTFKPVRGKADPGQTFYQSFAGKNCVLMPGQRLTFAAIADGTSNTFMIAEAEKPVVWTKPEDIVFDGKMDGKERPKLGGMFNGHFHVVFCDGSVRFVSSKIETSELRNYITTNGGEVANELPTPDLFPKD